MKETESPFWQVWAQKKSRDRQADFRVVFMGSYPECRKYVLEVETSHFRIEKVKP